MEKDHLEKLIANYLSGKGTREENLELKNWYASFENDPGLTNKLTESERLALETMILERIDERIRLREHKTTASERQFEVSPPLSRARQLHAYRYQIAAVFIGLLVMAVIGYQSFNRKTVFYATGYGETATIVLPDHSTVILNGHSTLRYENDWNTEGIREVHLDGEAFFSVAPTKTRQKFIVNISEVMNVEVLGTKFNVSKRKSGTRVVLNSGKVLLNLKQPEGPGQVMMNPGELVEFEGENSTDYVKKKVNVDIYSAWRNHKLIFDNTTLQQVIIMLEDNYGLKSRVSDNELLELKVSGTIPAENIESLLKNISITYGITIQRNDNVIEITQESTRN